MDKENIRGAAQTVKGEIEEVAGKVISDKELELRGKADQFAGAVRNAVGTVQDTVKDAVKEASKP